MSMWVSFSILLVAAYLLGSVCAAIPICQLFKLPDPRSMGSANPGATNVMRLGGKLPAALTFLVDAFKAAPPILAAVALQLHPAMVSMVAFAAILGHVYPLYFRFVGGKGVATAFGILLVLDWRLFMAAGLSWMAVFAVVRISAVASLMAMVLAAPVASFYYAPQFFLGVSLIGLLILWRHKQNIRDLVLGVERGF